LLLVIDAMGTEFGGVRTYADHLLAAWATSFPEDVLHVVVPAGSTIPTGTHVRHEIAVPRPGVLGRPVAQTRHVDRIIGQLQPDAVLALIPSTTLRRPSRPMAVVVHDLRHQLRPEQFTRTRRVIRFVAYGRAYALASGFVAVSDRTLADLHALQPATRERPAAVVHHGADHVLDWPEPSRDGEAVAFALHTNKNPGLILQAWALLAEQAPPPPLVLVGVRSEAREGLQREIDRLGLGGSVRLSAFLPEDEFRRTVARASMIVFPSDFEGFGLPVVEGMSLGKPVVVGPDPAVLEVAAGHAAVMADWTPRALADAVASVGSLDLEAARSRGRTFTWDRAVRQTRELLQAIARQG
jgi:glycosyltransferase involved in cell wall biosynthesis